MLQDSFTMEINGKMSGGLNTFASNCSVADSLNVCPEKPLEALACDTLGLLHALFLTQLGVGSFSTLTLRDPVLFLHLGCRM